MTAMKKIKTYFKTLMKSLYPWQVAVCAAVFVVTAIGAIALALVFAKANMIYHGKAGASTAQEPTP